MIGLNFVPNVASMDQKSRFQPKDWGGFPTKKND